MALLSNDHYVENDKKWMWSSVVTGGTAFTLLLGAFYGLSSNISYSPGISTEQIAIEQSSAKEPSQFTFKPTLPQEQKVIKVATKEAAPTYRINRSAKSKPSFISAMPEKVATNKAEKTGRTKPNLIDIAINSSDGLVEAGTPKKVVNNGNSIVAKTIDLTKIKNDEQPLRVAGVIKDLSKAKSEDKIGNVPQSEKVLFEPKDSHQKVVRGDTLTKILKRNGATSSEAQAIINKLRPHLKVNALEVGQPLTITLSRRKSNNNIYPSRVIIPLGFAPNKPDAILKERIAVNMDEKRNISLELPASKNVAVASATTAVSGFNPAKPKKAPKYSVAKDAKSLTNQIATLTKDPPKAKTPVGGNKTVYYRTKSKIRSSIKNTIASQRLPRDVQSRILSVYSKTIKKSRIRSSDTIEVFYNQTEDKDGKLVKLGKLLYVSFKMNGKTYTYYRYGNQFYDRFGKSIAPSTGGGFLANPVPGARMSSKFGMRRHPVTRRWRMHSGTDYAAPRGTPIYAAASGKIKIAKWQGGFGRYIEINHPNGFATGYAHMTRFAKGMSAGKNVRRGQIIGYVGTTGLSTGNHLHFILKKGTKKLDSRKHMGSGGIAKLSGSSLKKFNNEMSRIKTQLSKTRSVTRIANR